jgi:hypothetical protein
MYKRKDLYLGRCCEHQYDSNSLQALFRSCKDLMPSLPSCSSISLLVSRMIKTPT